MMSSKDCGHYVERPVPEDALRIPAGQERSVVKFISGDERFAFALEERSQLSLCIVILPGADASVDIVADMLGEYAEARLSGVYVCRGRQKVELRVQVNHRAACCSSRQLFKGVAAEASNTVFSGRITVAPGADLTEAFQENHNLLLSDTARAETRPQLEIYTDDVACSHGATLGRLDLEEQFYMRSRGIPEEEAKVLQMVSFLAPALSFGGSAPSAEFSEAVEEAVRAL
ncbi:MAG: SufD family Fe-S cluster assembly protein [Bacteroidia bacterium]|nr:SufD family Fe-S cluster assembly protein [Bacteroidia bacterium]